MLGWKTLIHWGEDFLRERCCGWLHVLVQEGISQRLPHLRRLSAGLFMFSQIFFPQACYPSLVDEQDTPQGEALLQTGHLSSLTIHQFPFKQLVNKAVYSFKLNHWKAAQATVKLVNQFAIQSRGLITLLVNQAKKVSSILWKQKYFDSKQLSICQIMSKSIMSCRFRSVMSLKTCSMIVLLEYCSDTGEMVHSGLFSLH